MTMKSAADSDIDFDFLAQEVLDSYINAGYFDQGADFQILSTIRYEPLLEEHANDFNDVEHLKASIEIPNQELNADTESDLVNDPSVAGNPVALLQSSQFFLFDEHLRRIRASLAFFKWPFQITKEILLSKLNDALAPVDKNFPYKCRVLIAKNGELQIEIVPVPIKTNLMEGFFKNPVEANIWSVYIDKQAIPISPFTSFKTTKREHYSQARSRSLPTDPAITWKEVLVYNEAGQVMEGSITNVAFKRNKIYPSSGEIVERWVTPPLSSGCLCGVVRHMLIEKELIEEDTVKLSDVNKGEDILLFNGIIGVVRGRIM